MFLYFQKSGRVFDKSADVDPLESGIVTGLFGMDAATWDQLIQAGEEGTCTIIQDPNMDFARFVYVRQIYPGVVWMIGVNSSRIAEDLSYYYLPEDAQTLFLTANNRSISSANAYGQPATCRWTLNRFPPCRPSAQGRGTGRPISSTIRGFPTIRSSR